MCSALPFFGVEHVPATDLPQHLAQVRLLAELWGLAPATVELSELRARPFGPNGLVYLPLLLLGELLPMRLAGRVGLLLLVWGVVGALHGLALRRGRSPVLALLAGVLVFSAPLYWGFVGFLLGLCLFLLASEVLLRPWGPAGRRRCGLRSAGLLGVLAWAHLLWLPAAGLAALVAAAAAPKGTRKVELAARAAALLPATLYVGAFLPTLSHARTAGGFATKAVYESTLWERMTPEWVVSASFGAVRGPLEPLTAAGLGLFAVGSVLVARKRGQRLRSELDIPLLALGAGLLLFGFVAPDRYFTTLAFGTRFVPAAAMLLALSLPAPTLRGRSLVLPSVIVACLGFHLTTAWVWSAFDEHELSGLSQSIDHAPGPSSVLGLDFRKDSELVRGRPFLQTFAYLQAERGGIGSFSFAQHPSSAVIYERPRRITWTPALDFYPERARPADLERFDCVLVNGEEDVHQSFAEVYGAASPVRQGYFRLYCRFMRAREAATATP